MLSAASLSAHRVSARFPASVGMTCVVEYPARVHVPEWREPKSEVAMRLGVIFPQIEIGSDPAEVREFVRRVEESGYDHLAIYDHVLGADVAERPNWRGPYTSETEFHEVLTFFGFCAGITTRLELVTSILILPQRQTALVAKQAAEIDILSGGRLRLGVGLGWNDVEYQALNENFHNRGRRIEEQIEVMRKLWTNPVVTFHRRWHTI